VTKYKKFYNVAFKVNSDDYKTRLTPRPTFKPGAPVRSLSTTSSFRRLRPTFLRRRTLPVADPALRPRRRNRRRLRERSGESARSFPTKKICRNGWRDLPGETAKRRPIRAKADGLTKPSRRFKIRRKVPSPLSPKTGRWGVRPLEAYPVRDPASTSPPAPTRRTPSGRTRSLTWS
jgi:hypothetical protein